MPNLISNWQHMVTWSRSPLLNIIFNLLKQLFWLILLKHVKEYHFNEYYPNVQPTVTPSTTPTMHFPYRNQSASSISAQRYFSKFKKSFFFRYFLVRWRIQTLIWKNVQVENAMQGVQFIAQHIRDNDKDNEVKMKIRWNIGILGWLDRENQAMEQDWKYIEM